MEIGKLPPQALEIENAVLGACLLGGDAFNTVKGIINPKTFYKEQNQLIYTAILNLSKKSTTIDILTVMQELKKMEKLEVVGGAYYVSKLTERVASDANIEQHARIIVEKELLRNLIVIGNNLVVNAYDDTSDVFDLIDKNIQKSFEMINFKSNNKTRHIGDVHKETVSKMHEILDSGKTSGIPSGLEYIDNLTNGWQKSDSIIIAARPGMGKTAFALKLCKHPALELNIPTAIFSIEMSAQQLIGRLQSSESWINNSKIITNSLNNDEILNIERTCVDLAKAPIYIDDTPSLSITDFKQKAKKLVIENGVQLIVIDYLQLMTSDSSKGNREQEISQISRGIKQTAKELQIPIIALSQLSRKVEDRPGKKPMLADLRESGSLEQDADMVMFLYRPEYYGITEDYEIFGKTYSPKGLLVSIIAKNRHGALGDLPFKFSGQFMRVDNLRSDNNQMEETSGDII